MPRKKLIRIELRVSTIFNYRKRKPAVNVSFPHQPGEGFREPPRASAGPLPAPPALLPRRGPGPPAPPELLQREGPGLTGASWPRGATASPPVLQVLVHGRRAAGGQRQPLHGGRGTGRRRLWGPSPPRAREQNPEEPKPVLPRPAAPPPTRLPIGPQENRRARASTWLPTRNLASTLNPSALGMLFTGLRKPCPSRFPWSGRCPCKITRDEGVQRLACNGCTEHGLFLCAAFFSGCEKVLERVRHTSP